MLLFLRSRKGQFIPMSAMVMLSVSVFMVGVVDVYRISRAKLKAQNLADAVALYVAGQMTQSMNHVTDRNEWMNHLYSDPNNPNSSLAGANPCNVPKDSPPGLGCFASGNATYEFSSGQAVQSYATLVQSINQIQQLFSQSYNTLLGTNGAQGSNGQSSLQENLLRNMPALADPGVQLVVFNSQNTKQSAEAQAQNQLKQGPNANGKNMNLYLDALQFAVNDSIIVKYKSGIEPLIKHKKMSLENSIAGGNGGQKIGVMALAKQSQAGSPTNAYLDSSGSIGAGAIVTIPVQLSGFSTTVQAKSVAYTVLSAGSMDPHQNNGSFRPTYWVKLGKPL